MISDAQYAALGRLSLAFNELDLMVGRSLGHILSIPEFAIGQMLSDEAQFSRKVSQLSKVLRILEAEYPELKPQLDSFLLVLQRCTSLGQSRNQYMHAVAWVDLPKSMVRFYGKNGELSFETQAIESLAQDCKDTVEDVFRNLSRLFPSLQAARARAESQHNNTEMTE